MEFYAHSAAGENQPSEKWQKLAPHLKGVARLSRQFAEAARPADENFAQAAELAGLLHDIGKYRTEFQDMLLGRHPKNELTRHKQAGAAIASDQRRLDLAFAIAGHHGGLPDRVGVKELVEGPGGRAVAESIWPAAVADCPEVNQPIPALARADDPIVYDILTRLLFSCLVDADWQDTSAHERHATGLDSEAGPPLLEPGRLLANVLEYIAARSENCPDRRIAEVRRQILDAALHAAELRPGLFSFTVPTGGGKTLSGLAFALKHAHTFGLRRVIYAAPYLSIIEQNAREIRRALGVDHTSPLVFEHHSLAEPPDGSLDETDTSTVARRAENWDSPVVVTTNVQFFESLFSNRPGRCRKLHNIARSVVVLDECQTLPPDVVAPTCSMLSQLTEFLGCTVVLCTATQPALGKRPDLAEGLEGVREIIPRELKLFDRLRRVRIEWPTLRDDSFDWPHVARRMCAEDRALCIVNTRRAAFELFDYLRKNGCSGALHLSTTMCPAHRLAVIDEVRKRLASKRECHLVSTQLIECGCDVDFPLVLREMAPLEAIIQSAGRCNREGLLNAADGSPGGETIVFRSKDGSMPPDRWYHAGRAVVEQDFLNHGRHADIGCPEDIGEYFLRLYRTGELDQRNIQNLRRGMNFASVSQDYQIIDSETVPVVVASWAPKRIEIDAILSGIRRRPCRELFRSLARFQVNLRVYELEQAAGCWVEDGGGVKVWFGNYDDSLGIDPKNVLGLPVI